MSIEDLKDGVAEKIQRMELTVRKKIERMGRKKSLKGTFFKRVSGLGS